MALGWVLSWAFRISPPSQDDSIQGVLVAESSAGGPLAHVPTALSLPIADWHVDSLPLLCKERRQEIVFID